MLPLRAGVQRDNLKLGKDLAARESLLTVPASLGDSGFLLTLMVAKW